MAIDYTDCDIPKKYEYHQQVKTRYYINAPIDFIDPYSISTEQYFLNPARVMRGIAKQQLISKSKKKKVVEYAKKAEIYLKKALELCYEDFENYHNYQ